jgi:hypothetical protein
MNNRIIFAILAFITTCIACSDTKEQKIIIGNWIAVEWLMDGKLSLSNARNTSFTFNEKGEYTYTNSGVITNGTYKVENNMLFTTPLNEQEMMVKIVKLTKDSLVFDMNRGGQPETLTLMKK